MGGNGTGGGAGPGGGGPVWHRVSFTRESQTLSYHAVKFAAIAARISRR